mmetsp:Transcript_28721/g.57395  ORF Transcript_28721/g.57395 Transcript_28721/m.57395 type:complete len:171 (+) Transcript_28721:1-513(+)|eukprot:CAMPEP_0170369644 /NCGR_PEP_ID=MMETSP0117_2-20130122/8093_1 /TAXON_ID=400756 /ORGANISM="Durinskia baltica, Strain CSIRO CS-38" /LENGTH=170 /DNA_ID=CAMNT_0010624377 /DNA_START=1 /DNA_END=513 /DNA_ORIENTATION=+
MNSNRLKNFLAKPLRPIADKVSLYIDKPTRVTKGGLNFHKSNRAKEGLYHGKDVLFGHSISHSHTRSKRMWKPNVQSKRMWSEALEDWVRFNMTSKAIKAADNVGGIDNYIVSLDNDAVKNSNYVTKMRGLIGSKMYHQGLLHNSIIKHLGYDKNPPPLVTADTSTETAK